MDPADTLAIVSEPFEVLTVCTANICRSPVAAHAIKHVFDEAADEAADEARVSSNLLYVRSCGTHAEPGDPQCPQGAALIGADPRQHRARLLKPRLVATAGLIVTADRGQRGAAARMWPECRPRLFTLTQGAFLAAEIADHIANGNKIDGAPLMPDDAKERLHWMVTEMDVIRGSMAGLPDEYSDIEDQHGPMDHTATLAQVQRVATALAGSMLLVVTQPVAPRVSR